MLWGFSYSSYLSLFLIVSQVSRKLFPPTFAGMLEQRACFFKAPAENWPAVGLRDPIHALAVDAA